LTVGGGGGWTAPPPQVATTPDFPPNEFRGGVLAATSVRLPQRTGSLTFTAESLDLMIVTTCDFGRRARLTFTVNGQRSQGEGASELTCGQAWPHESLGEAETFWTRFGVRVGEPFTFGFEASVDEGVTAGTLSVGIAQQ